MTTHYQPTMRDFDWQQLRQLSDEDTDFEAELLEMFLQDAERSLKDLELAIASRSIQAVENIAHSLHGASANVGATALALAASQLEQMARSGKLNNVLTDAQVLLQQIRTHCQSIRIHLDSAPLKKPEKQAQKLGTKTSLE